jgi:tryptophan-rich sensory protein
MNQAIMSKFNKKQQALALVMSLTICYAVSFVGAMASINAKQFYASLVQPSWSPPGWLFGPVWIILYTMMGLSAWMIWRKNGFNAHRSSLLLYLFHLIPNALWGWLFFSWHLGAASFINIIVLWLLILITIFAFFRINKPAAMLLVPYLCWVSFAAALNYALWQNNPAIL